MHAYICAIDCNQKLHYPTFSGTIISQKKKDQVYLSRCREYFPAPQETETFAFQ